MQSWEKDFPPRGQRKPREDGSKGLGANREVISGRWGGEDKFTAGNMRNVLGRLTSLQQGLSNSEPPRGGGLLEHELLDSTPPTRPDGTGLRHVGELCF